MERRTIVIEPEFESVVESEYHVLFTIRDQLILFREYLSEVFEEDPKHVINLEKAVISQLEAVCKELEFI